MVYQNQELPFNQTQDNSPVYKRVLSSILTNNLDFHDQDTDYASHNFHSFPAKFPPQLPHEFIQKLTSPGEIVLDPMVGSGTTILEGYLDYRRTIGFDIDPLALKLTKVKTTPLIAVELLDISHQLLRRAIASVQDHSDLLENMLQDRFDEPTQNFFNQWFLRQTQIELLALLQQIEAIADPRIKSFFEICFSAIIITKSGGISLALDLGHTRPHLAKRVVDRAGNVLYGTSIELPSHQIKIMRSVFNDFEKRVNQNLRSLLKQDRNRYEPVIEFGNAQNLPIDDSSVDLIVTSPPYASNAIDYMRAHKFSLVWLNYSIDELSKKRKEYIGGESTVEIKFEALPSHSAQVVSNIYEKDEKKALVLHRYYSEMTRVLAEMYRVLRTGKSAIVVVGNSIMRGEDTQTAQCLAEIGTTLGFQVPHIGVRYLDRDRRMLPASQTVDKNSQIQQRMHEEYIIGFYKS